MLMLSTIYALACAKKPKSKPTMSANPQHVVDTEDAAELNLGDDFRNETCLSNAEVAVILEKQKSDYENQEKQLTGCVRLPVCTNPSSSFGML